MKSPIKDIKPVSNPVQNDIGMKVITRLRLGLRNLNEHKSKHNFQSCINLLCNCSLEVESTVQFFLYCQHYHNIRAKLLNSLEVIDTNLLKLSEEQLTKVLFYGFYQLYQNQNRNILNSSTLESKHFESSLGINFYFLNYILL